MKSLKMILALVLVLAMTGTTFAAFTLGPYTIDGHEAGDGTDIGNGLTSYTITVAGASVFKQITIGSGVHQVWTSGFGGPAQPTLYSDTITLLGWPDNAGATAADSFFIFKNAGTPITPTLAAGSIAESNTLGGSPIADGGLGGFPTMADYKQGMGTIGDPVGEFGFGILDFDPSTDTLTLMQVVLLEGTSVVMTGILGVEGSSDSIGSLVVGVPEPSTILMLLAGSLCLLAVRSRK